MDFRWYSKVSTYWVSATSISRSFIRSSMLYLLVMTLMLMGRLDTLRMTHRRILNDSEKTLESRASSRRQRRLLAKRAPSLLMKLPV